MQRGLKEWGHPLEDARSLEGRSQGGTVLGYSQVCRNHLRWQSRETTVTSKPTFASVIKDLGGARLQGGGGGMACLQAISARSHKLYGSWWAVWEGQRPLSV